ncbi:MAG: carboxypeptidase regulatory-like domain-containing protein [Gemmatimonadetes bacterium]|nr:carboxypeptidase regulatory-like domain-containing protein [Gemmatimonadota bacterium]
MRVRWAVGVFVGLGVAGLWACGGGGDGGGTTGPPTQPPGAGTVTGRVTNLAGAGIPGIIVHLRQLGAAADAKPTQTTNAQGSYTFTQVAAGDYRVFIELPDTFSADGRPTEDTVAVQAGATATAATFQLRLKTGTVAGVVTDTGNVLLPNRTVVLRRSGTTDSATATTASSGSYSFGNVTVGQYTVSVRLQCGEQAGAVSLTVPDQQTATANIQVTTRGPGFLLSCEVQPIFSRSCGIAGCHSGGSSAEPPEKPMDLSTAANTRANTINVKSAQQPTIDRIKPFFADSASSYLVCKIIPNCVLRVLSRMPLTGTLLTTAQIDTIRTWIAQGAKDAP